MKTDQQLMQTDQGATERRVNLSQTLKEGKFSKNNDINNVNSGQQPIKDLNHLRKFKKN